MVIYWFIVACTLLYLIWKYRTDGFGLLLILTFYSGLTAYYGKAIENPYKILLLAWSLFYIIRYKALKNLDLWEHVFLIMFFLFSSSLILSGVLNHDSGNMIFSQYSKFLIVFCIYFVLKKHMQVHINNILYYKHLLLLLLWIQIFLAFCKWGTIGIQEWIVGSISFEGGAQATPLPILGFMLIWLHKKGELKRNDWIMILLLLVISFVSLKRAIWFIMPIFVLLFIYYVPGKNINIKKVIYFIPLVPLIFYIGVRFNPSLNKENKFGGSFDLQFVMDYVMKYNFGETEKTKNVQLGQGRGGATLLIWDKIQKHEQLSSNDFWGYGLSKMYASDYDTFDTFDFGLSNKGAATGIFQSYVTSGFIGICAAFLFLFSVIRLINPKRVRITIGIFIFYDYLFYNWSSIRTPALFVLLLFIILYSNKFDEINEYQTSLK